LYSVVTRFLLQTHTSLQIFVNLWKDKAKISTRVPNILKKYTFSSALLLSSRQRKSIILERCEYSHYIHCCQHTNTNRNLTLDIQDAFILAVLRTDVVKFTQMTAFFLLNALATLT